MKRRRVKKSTPPRIFVEKSLPFVNYTLTPNMQYPNNTFSQFYTLLPEEIHLSSSDYKAALTEIHYPVNYSVYLGSIKLETPFDYDQEIDVNVITQIEENQEAFENEFLNMLTKQVSNIEELKNNVFQVEEIASALEKNLSSYLSLLTRYTSANSRLRFYEIKNGFKNFTDRQLHNSNTLPQTHEIYRNFVTKILILFENINNKFDAFNTPPTNQQIKIDIKMKDRINKKEFFNMFYNEFRHFCTINKQDSILVLKDSVRIIEMTPSLENFISIKNNFIIFDKFYPLNHVKNFFIYTDIISQSIHNNCSTPILRLVTTKGKYGDFVNIVYDRPHFEPINKTRISKIFIKITDQFENLIEFHSGPIILKLEIRK